jgi:predicted transcriptional regulator
LARRLELRVGRGGDALDRFEAGWNRLLEGRKLAELHVLTLEDLPRFLATLTPARWRLLDRLRQEGPLSIYQLAKRLERNYKNVHTDVSRLIELGLIERAEDGRVSVPWDVVRAEY